MIGDLNVKSAACSNEQALYPLHYPPIAADALVQSTCAYCGVGCGVDISVTEGQATSLEGSPEHPANFGRLCVKGTHLLDTVDVTNRLLAPEVAGQQVSWQTAIAQVADKFSETIEKYGKDAVAFYVSGQLLTEDYYVANKLMKGYIGSANIDTNSRLCMSSAVSAYKRAFGEDVVPCDYQDLEQTDLMVLIGSNAAWTHPVLFQRMQRAKQINPACKLVVVDPRRTATAESADLHLAITPGSDAALYNGLLNYLAERSALDHDYIAAHTQGFEETIAQASAWGLTQVSEFCGVTKAELLSFYQYFEQANKAISMYSMGINQSTSGVDKCHAIINVHLATGKIAKAGAGPFSITGQPNAMGGREVGGLANQLAAHMDIENPAHRDLVQTFWQSPHMPTKQGAKAVDMIEQMLTGKIKAVWVMGTNPLVSLPDHNQVAKAFEQCDFVVVSDCVTDNDTLAYADVKLPATPWLEKNGTVTNSERRISRQRSAVKPTGEAKHDWDIMSLVAQKMGFSGFAYQHPYQVFTEFAALSGYQNAGASKRVFDMSGLAPLSLTEYEQLQPVQWPIPMASSRPSQAAGASQIAIVSQIAITSQNKSTRVFANGEYATANGKANFFPVTPKLPEQKASKAFPLVLNSGRFRDQWHTMTRTGVAPALTQHLAKPFLSVNPVDASKYGLSDHQIAKVSSAKGELYVPVQVSDAVAVGECFMPIHWNQEFCGSATVSSLYDAAVDPISGQPELKHTGIAITAAKFEQYIDCYVSQALAEDIESQSGKRLVKSIAQHSAYWLKTKQPNSWHYQLATKTDQALTMARCQQLFPCQGEWLSFTDNDSQLSHIVCLKNGAVMFAAYFATAFTAASAESDFGNAKKWVDDLFAEESLSFTQVQALLSKTAPAAADESRKVCSCFNVTENSIREAVQAGADSVTALGKKLKCGTNCGSCKPELQTIINTCQSQLIDIKEVASA
ncbi:nitrate reductase [Thalassotalea euphylliae]|uniref:Nitrate reductase n=1 Tax=Thalassotalea euphylliae TaxID=1655234 RepID=A0A3E0TS71_9GAMM|nr:nitrate reductase [Thalassotalea euphylliae]REL26765.1 nitrate reductase [Thalassotalea euphylliae]